MEYTAYAEHERSAEYEEQKVLWQRLCYIFLIFIVGCLIGWLYEEIFYWVSEGALRNRGILYGPWLPIYGIGALGIYALKPIKKHPAALFVLCIVITGIVEYAIGWAGITIFGLRLWDYSGLFCNIKGIVCLRSVLSFAVMGLAFHYIIEPEAERRVCKIKEKTIYCISIILALFIMADCILSALFRTPIVY